MLLRERSLFLSCLTDIIEHTLPDENAERRSVFLIRNIHRSTWWLSPT